MRRLTITISVTPEEYADLVDYVIAQRQDCLCPEPASALMQEAISFELGSELSRVIKKLIGHEGSPTFWERVRQYHEAEQAEAERVTAA